MSALIKNRVAVLAALVVIAFSLAFPAGQTAAFAADSTTDLAAGGSASMAAQAGTPSVSYRVHVQNDGWQAYMLNGQMAGTEGQSLRVEALKIKLDNGSFSPNESITVADAAYMIASVLKLPGVDSESVSSGESDKTFASLLAATNAGIFDTAEPTQTITKSECAEILCRIDDYMTENNMNRLRD